MRTLTIKCDDRLAKTIVELLLDERAVFSIATEGDGLTKTKSPWKATTNNKGLKAILDLGKLRPVFTIKDVEVHIQIFGLSVKSASPAVSRSVSAGFLNRDGKNLMLTEKGKVAAAKMIMIESRP